MKNLNWIFLSLILALGILSAIFGGYRPDDNDTKTLDVLYVNANFYSYKDSIERFKIVGVKDGKIVFLSKSNIKKLPNALKTIDLNGLHAYSGLADAHCHFLGYAYLLNQVNLIGSKSWDDVIEKSKKAVLENGWIIGRGWDQNDWENKVMPTNDLLNKLFPNTPIILKRIDGHALICNDLVLKMAKINEKTQINGGEIQLINGIPTGLLIDNAMQLVEHLIPKKSNLQKIEALKKMEQICFKNGLTQLTDAGLDLQDILLLDSLLDANVLKIKLNVMVNLSENNLAYFEKHGSIDKAKLKVKSFKIYADGALGSRGALLKSPYCDHGNHSGLNLLDSNTIKKQLQRIYNLKFQACTHCIGDKANFNILNLYAQILPKNNKNRWRIEHAQIIDMKDISMFGTYRILPSVQPTHATSDMYWAESRLCTYRLVGAYAYQSLLKQNNCLPLGTDFPVEDVNPLNTIRASVFRKDQKGYPNDGFQNQNALTIFQTLKGMTYDASYAAFWENKMGYIAIGNDADFSLFNVNFNQISFEELSHAYCISTIIDGEYVYNSH